MTEQQSIAHTVLPVTATVIALLPTSKTQTELVDCACSSRKRISTSHVSVVQHID